MSTKTFSNVRTKQKHDVESNWLKATGFAPLDGELIIYDVDEIHSKPRLKIGNGEQNVNLLPFIGSDIELKSGTNVEINKNEDDSYTISATYTYTLPQATEENLGGVKIGYTQVDKNYPIVLDTEGKMYVNVPWTDTQQNSFSKFSFIDGENELTIEALNSTDTLKIQVGSGLNATTNIAGDEFILSAEVTKSYVDEVIANLVDTAPDTLNTLNELAAALGDDPNFATTITGLIGEKVSKVEGKGLSTNDFTNELKDKLNSIENNANNYSLPIATSEILGGVKSGTDITIDESGNVSVNDNSHNHSTDNITSGILSIARGGTGVKFTDITPYAVIRNSDLDDNGNATGLWYTSTANGAFYATGADLPPTFGILPVAQGGTGAVNASAARTNLGAAPAPVSSTISTTGTIALAENIIYTLTTSASSYTFNCNSITGNYGCHICITMSSKPTAITFSNATTITQDTTAFASGQYWEISVFKKHVVMRCLKEA